LRHLFYSTLTIFSTAIWQLNGGKHRTPNMRYRAYKLRTQSTLLITRCIMAKFRYFKKAKFHYFKQVVNLSATCFHVVLEQFLACFRVVLACQRQLGFLVFSNERILRLCEVQTLRVFFQYSTLLSYDVSRISHACVPTTSSLR